MFGGLDAEAYDRQYSDRQLLGRILDYFRPHRRALVTLTLWVAVMAVSGAAVPITVSRGVSSLGPQPTAGAIGLLAGLILLYGVLIWAANYLRRRLSA